MPLISDPGYRLVAAARDAGIAVSGLPGPSAVMLALAICGLPTDRFAFDGFVPRRASERRRYFGTLRSESRTTVVFEAPHRLAASLQDAAAELEERDAAVCRELTKPHEEVRRGTLAQLAQWAQDGVRGEITVVIAGATAGPIDLQGAVGEVRALVAQGVPRGVAASQVAAETGHRKKALYDGSLLNPEG